MIFDYAHPDLPKKIKTLIVDKTVDVSIGSDHVDLYAKMYYNDYDYWIPLCMYNDIINPFNLVDQGITKFKLFKKVDYQELIREISKNDRNSG